MARAYGKVKRRKFVDRTPEITRNVQKQLAMLKPYKPKKKR